MFVKELSQNYLCTNSEIGMKAFVSKCQYIMTYTILKIRYLTTLLLIIGGFALSAQDAAPLDLAAGKTIFVGNCAQCHARDMVQKMTGPALAGDEERWADYPREDLYAWIRNSQSMVFSTKHPRAVELWAEWGPTVMSNFTGLSDQDIENVLGYINDIAVNGIPKPPPPPGGEVVTQETDNTPLFIILALILAILAVVLARIIANLSYMTQVQEGTAPAKRKSLLEILTSRGMIAFVVFALIVAGGYTTVNSAIQLGRQQGYEPGQPIKFSHQLHAGLQKIDCQYCHDGARRSKHSVIPAANTCMNCHRAVKIGSLYGTAELTKIYASIGYDPVADTYIENYDQLSRDDIKRIYTKWIADTYVQEKGTLDNEGERVINEQWEGIVKALTNEDEGDESIAGPIEWVRIHNLPDHAYFNHAQHVTVGQVACQTCHGPVEEMEEVYQYSPLSMGWCINCHRQTEVQFANNPYYDSYEHYHEQIQEGTRTKVTVEDIGGLECQKCHY